MRSGVKYIVCCIFWGFVFNDYVSYVCWKKEANMNFRKMTDGEFRLYSLSLVLVGASFVIAILAACAYIHAIKAGAV